MRIRVRDTERVMSESEYKEAYAHLSPPPTLTEEWLNGAGADIIFNGPAASGGTVYQYSMEDGVEQKSDGKWYSKHILGPVFTDTTDSEGNVTTAADNEANWRTSVDNSAAEVGRQERNIRLAKTDWMGMSDTTMSAEWATYRQALRDVPAQEGFPHNITWPDEP